MAEATLLLLRSAWSRNYRNLSSHFDLTNSTPPFMTPVVKVTRSDSGDAEEQDKAQAESNGPDKGWTIEQIIEYIMMRASPKIDRILDEEIVKLTGSNGHDSYEHGGAGGPPGSLGQGAQKAAPRL